MLFFKIWKEMSQLYFTNQFVKPSSHMSKLTKLMANIEWIMEKVCCKTQENDRIGRSGGILSPSFGSCYSFPLRQHFLVAKQNSWRVEDFMDKLTKSEVFVR